MRKIRHPLAALILLLSFFSFSAKGQVAFTLSSSGECAPVEVNLANTSSVGEQYVWHINGTTLNGAEIPTQTFTQEGTHHIKLEAFDANGNSLGNYEEWFDVKSGLPSIVVKPGANICPGEQVKVEVMNQFTEIEWDFGNGMTASNNYVPVSYNTPGEYIVTVSYETESCGVQTNETTINVSQSAEPTPSAHFVSNSQICPNDLVVIEGDSEEYTYQWTISPLNITLEGRRFEYAFSTVGDYEINYTVTNKCGKSATSEEPLIVTVGTDVSPYADFEFWPQQACPNTPIRFKAKGSGIMEWTFTDGFTTNEAEFEYFFPEEGTHSVQLKVTNGCGLVSEPIVHEVNVATNPEVQIDVHAEIRIGNRTLNNSTPICTNTEVNLVAYGTHTDGIQYTWTIAPKESPDDKIIIANARDTKYTLANEGEYIIQAIAQDPCGANGMGEMVINVSANAVPDVQLQATPMKLCPGDKVYFYDNDNNFEKSPGISYSINFGDGSELVGPITSILNPELNILAEHVYTEHGVYTATFKAISACGGEHVKTLTIDVTDNQDYIPTHYVSNSTADSPPPVDKNLDTWNQNISGAHQFALEVEMTSLASEPSLEVFAFFWYGQHTLSEKMPKPDGKLPITLTNGMGTGTAYVPTGQNSEVTIGVAYYCDQIADFTESPASLTGIYNIINSSSTFSLVNAGNTTPEKTYLNPPVTECSVRSKVGVWKASVNQMNIELNIQVGAESGEYSIRKHSGTEWIVFETGYLYSNGDNYDFIPNLSDGCVEITGNYQLNLSENELNVSAVSDECTERMSLINTAFSKDPTPPKSLIQKLNGEWVFENQNGTTYTISFWKHAESEEYVNLQFKSRNGDAYDEISNGLARILDNNTIANDGQIRLGFQEETPTGEFTNDNQCPEIQAIYDIIISDGMLSLLENGTDECAKRKDAFTNKSFARMNSKYDVCAGDKVKFKAVGGQSYQWNFGDANNTTSTQQFPTFVYNESGVYNAYVSITNNCGRTDKLYTAVTVKENIPISAEFNLPYEKITIGQVIKPEFYKYNRDYDNNTYSWNFGDGTTLTTREVEHQYDLPGEYEISLTITNACGTTTHTRKVYVDESLEEYCKANFKLLSVDHAKKMIQVQNTSYDITHMEWNFGEFNEPVFSEANSSPVSFTFETAGKHPVSLSVFNENTGCTDFFTIPVEVGETNQECFLNITPIVNPTTKTVEFKVEAPASLSEWYWTFGDLSTSQEAPKNGSITKVYDVADRYKVHVFAFGDNGCDVSQDLEVTVGETSCGITADFSFFPDHTNKTVRLKAETTGDVDKFIWNFGDGTQGEGRLAEHTYLDNRTYFVTLIARNSTKKCGDKIGKFIRLGEDVCKAAFEYKVDPTSNSVSFVNQSIGADEFFWSFDNSEFSTEKSPTHQYSEPGLYFVHLLARNSTTGSIHDIVQEVQVGISECEAYFDFSIEGKTVTFEDKSFGKKATTQQLWLFGDGSEVFGETNPQHTFRRGGNFMVTMLIGDVETGCFSEYTELIELETEEHFIQPDFAYKANFETRTVEFINKTTPYGGDFTYSWHFNDNSAISADEHPTHTFPAGKDIFRVSLTASKDINNDGVADIRFTTYKKVIIAKSCVADFTFTKDATKPKWVKCTNLSTTLSANATFTWNFNDEGEADTKDAAWTFSNSEDKLVFLSVQDGDCQDYAVKMINVSGESGIACGFNSRKSATASKKPAGHPRDFYGASSGGSALNWDFGDGNKKSSAVDYYSLMPTHTYEFPGTYTVTLTVTDQITGETAVHKKDVFINGIPIARAGSDQIVASGETVTLDGSNSIDETETGTFTYSWTAPEGVTLTGQNTAKPSFTAPDLDATNTYTFSLVVNDGEYNSEVDEVVVTVQKKVTAINDGFSFDSFQVFPNPASEIATINFTLHQAESLSLGVYDLSGKLIETLLNDYKSPNKYSVNWNLDQIKSGNYVIRLQAGSKIFNKQIVVK